MMYNKSKSIFTRFDEQFWKTIDELVATKKIVIDRQKGSTHPRFSSFIYPVDYGYLEETSAMDGNGIDVWVGTHEHKVVDAVMCIVDIMKFDAEIKLLIGCTDHEKELVYQTHNQSPYVKGLIIFRDKTT